MSRIGQAVDAIMEDRRANYLMDTKIAARAVNCAEKKFGQEWYRRRDWLMRLAVAQPGELAAEFAAILALAIDERERRDAVRPPMQIRNH